MIFCFRVFEDCSLQSYCLLSASKFVNKLSLQLNFCVGSLKTVLKRQVSKPRRTIFFSFKPSQGTTRTILSDHAPPHCQLPIYFPSSSQLKLATHIVLKACEQSCFISPQLRLTLTPSIFHCFTFAVPTQNVVNNLRLPAPYPRPGQELGHRHCHMVRLIRSCHCHCYAVQTN